MTAQVADAYAYVEITVEASQERAFKTFIDLNSWWERSGHHIGEKEPVLVAMEPRKGGRLYERDAAGRECDWGRVLAIEPPSRLLLDWQLTAAWTYDPNFHTDVDVRFVAEGEMRTRVELRHYVDAYGEKAADLRAMLMRPAAWPSLLEAFAATAKSA